MDKTSDAEVARTFRAFIIWFRMTQDAFSQVRFPNLNWRGTLR